MDVRSQQSVQLDVARAFVGRVLRWHLAGEDQVAFKPNSSARGCRLPGMVGLHRAIRYHHIGAVDPGAGQQVLQLAGFVSAGCEPGAIVTFHPYPWPAEFLRQSVEGDQRSRQETE